MSFGLKLAGAKKAINRRVNQVGEVLQPATAGSQTESASGGRASVAIGRTLRPSQRIFAR